MRKRIFDNLLVFFIISIPSAIFFFNLFYPKLQFFATPDFGRSDLWMAETPIRFFLSQSLKENSLPLWSKDIGTGFPLFAESQIGALNPMNLILYRLLPFPIAFNLTYPLIFLTSSLGTFFFCRAISLSKLASIFTGVIFSFSGLFFTQIPHVEIIQTASLLPWMFFLTYKIFKTPKVSYFLFFAITTSLSLFSNFAQTTFITFIGIAIFLVFLILVEKYSKYKKGQWNIKKTSLVISSFILATIWGIILASIQFIPTLEFITLSTRSYGFSLSSSTYFSFPPEHLLSFIDPFVFGNPSLGTYPDFISFKGSIFWENSGYLGIIPLLMAFFSVFIIKKKRFVLFFWILLFTSFLLMLGKYSPIRDVYSMPVFSLFRVPSRFILLFGWSLALLAGLYFDHIKETSGKYAPAIILYPLMIIILSLSFLDIYRVWYGYNPTVSSDEFFREPEMVKLINQNGKGRVFAIDRGDAWNKVFLSEGWQDANRYLYFRNLLNPNINLLYGIPQITALAGNTLSRPTGIDNLIAAGVYHNKEEGKILISPSSVKLLKLQNTSYIISFKEVSGNDVEKIKIIESKSENLPNLYLYRNKSLQRSYVVYNKIISKKENIPAILLGSSFDPSVNVILEKDDKLKISGPKASPKVDIIEDKNNSVKLSIKNNPAAGYLVLADTYYPGWKAFVNGVETEILVANLNQRAIFLPSGNHTILFQYNPLSFLIGKYVTAVSLIITFLLLTFSKQILIPVKKLLGK